MKFDVTQDDIEVATAFKKESKHYRSVTDCPIAVALNRQFGRKWLVWWETIDRLIGESLDRQFETSDEIREFISAFDSKQPVFPRSFEI